MKSVGSSQWGEGEGLRHDRMKSSMRRRSIDASGLPSSLKRESRRISFSRREWHDIDVSGATLVDPASVDATLHPTLVTLEYTTLRFTLESSSKQSILYGSGTYWSSALWRRLHMSRMWSVSSDTHQRAPATVHSSYNSSQFRAQQGRKGLHGSMPFTRPHNLHWWVFNSLASTHRKSTVEHLWYIVHFKIWVDFQIKSSRSQLLCKSPLQRSGNQFWLQLSSNIIPAIFFIVILPEN